MLLAISVTNNCFHRRSLGLISMPHLSEEEHHATELMLPEIIDLAPGEPIENVIQSSQTILPDMKQFICTHANGEPFRDEFLGVSVCGIIANVRTSRDDRQFDSDELMMHTVESASRKLNDFINAPVSDPHVRVGCLCLPRETIYLMIITLTVTLQSNNESP